MITSDMITSDMITEYLTLAHVSHDYVRHDYVRHDHRIPDACTRQSFVLPKRQTNKHIFGFAIQSVQTLILINLKYV